MYIHIHIHSIAVSRGTSQSYIKYVIVIAKW